MSVQKNRVWVLAVADAGVVDYVQVATSKAQANKELIDYLREYQDYTGPDDVKQAWLHVEGLDEHLSVKIVSRDLALCSMASCPGRHKGCSGKDLLQKCDFVVIGVNRHDPNPEMPVEAWAYKGPLDLDSATPLAFGLGTDCFSALKALEGHLSKPAANNVKGSGSTPEAAGSS